MSGASVFPAIMTNTIRWNKMSLDAISATTKALRGNPEFRNYLEDYENLARRLLNHVDGGA